jgi:N-acetylgalactosamine-6-sulfatase
MKLALTFVLAALVFGSIGSAFAADTSKPNIVFIYADDWGWGDLSCHGNTDWQTLNIDRLASEGIDFHQFYVASPICSPSRVSAMTGQFPGRYGITTVFGLPGKTMPDWLDPKAPMLPRLLKQAGYKTAHFGKCHMQTRVPDGPRMADYGFDESAVYLGLGPQIKHHAIGRRASEFIRSNKGKPFFLNVWLHETHVAHEATEASLEKWGHLDEQKRVYAAVVTEADNKVGMVLDALDQAGVADNTIVIFANDNGPEKATGPDTKGTPGAYGKYYSVGVTSGLRAYKGSIYEGGVRTPFIVRWPGRTPKGKKNESTVFGSVDLLPTLCAAAGVTPPGDDILDGENMLAAFQGEKLIKKRPLFGRTYPKPIDRASYPRLAVRDGDWKLMMNNELVPVALFNIPTDRSETKNVLKKHPEIAKRLSDMLRQWYATLPTEPDPNCVSKIPGVKKYATPKK